MRNHVCRFVYDLLSRFVLCVVVKWCGWGANAKAARVGGGARGAVTARAHHAAGTGVAAARCRMCRCLCANRLDTDFP